MIHEKKKSRASRELDSWTVNALKRFDEFNPDAGGCPAEFVLGGRSYSVGVRTLSPRDRSSDFSRCVEITEEKIIEGATQEFLVASADDLVFLPPNELVSGANGWLLVQDYPARCNVLTDFSEARRLPLEKAFPEYSAQVLVDLTSASEAGREHTVDKKRAEIAELDRMWQFHERASTRGDASLEQILANGDNYKGGSFFVKLIEFIGYVCPDGTQWTLTDIGHPGTKRRLNQGARFDQLAFGEVFSGIGWDWIPPGGRKLAPDEKLSGPYNPVVEKRNNLQVGPEWPDLEKRIRGIK